MDFIQCLHNLNHQIVCRLLRLVCFHKGDLHSQKGWILTRPSQLPGLHDKNCKVCQLDCLWNSPTTFLCCSADHGSVDRMIIFKKSLFFKQLIEKVDRFHILHRLFWSRVMLFFVNYGKQNKTKDCWFDFCILYIFCILNKYVQNKEMK